MKLINIWQEVRKTFEKSIDELLIKYLKPIVNIWQPSDLLPDSSSPEFYEEVKEIKELAYRLKNEFY